jgi:hypothetical protein
MPRHPNRRTVVRTAVWTAPAVAMATAAPALAASVGTFKLKFDTLNLFPADFNDKGEPQSLASNVQVENLFQQNGPTLTTLTLTVSYPDTRTSGGAPTQLTGAGWSFASVTHAGSSWVYAFLFVGSVPTSKSTSELDYHVPRTPGTGPVTITATAFAPGGSVVGTDTWNGK